MIVKLPPIEARPRRLEALVLAYVNDPAPALGQDGLRTQIAAVQRRARRDGIAIGLLIVESGGRQAATGRGMRLDDVLEAAKHDTADRVLYVADPMYLAAGPEAVLLAMDDAFAARIELRATRGRISPSGRTVTALRAAVTAAARGGERGSAVHLPNAGGGTTDLCTEDGPTAAGPARRDRRACVRKVAIPPLLEDDSCEPHPTAAMTVPASQVVGISQRAGGPTAGEPSGPCLVRSCEEPGHG